MIHTPLARRWIREVDRRAIEHYGMSSLVLMENAARGVADIICQLGELPGPIGIVCGKGNNAGDGLALARLLDGRAVPVTLILIGDPAQLSTDAAANYTILQRCGFPSTVLVDYRRDELAASLVNCGLIVDALLGTGAVGPPRPPLDQVIHDLNAHPARKLAIDVPSGLDCDTGIAASTTIRAAHTVTFVAPKPGLLTSDARQYVGRLHVADIGVPSVLLREVFEAAQREASSGN